MSMQCRHLIATCLSRIVSVALAPRLFIPEIIFQEQLQVKHACRQAGMQAGGPAGRQAGRRAFLSQVDLELVATFKRHPKQIS